MKMKVFRDDTGRVVNIGEWDYLISVEMDANGEEIQVARNPMPDGLIESEEDVVVGWDGGLYVEGDPRATQP